MNLKTQLLCLHPETDVYVWAQRYIFMKYYPVNLDIKNRNCLVVGGGVVGSRKAFRLLDCGALVTVVSLEFTDNLDKYSKENMLYQVLSSNKDNYFISLSVISPKTEELHSLGECYYKLINRKGFVASPVYSSHPVKRKPVVMFDAGSCFKKKFDGDVLDLSSNPGEAHPVWRYGKAMMIGV